MPSSGPNMLRHLAGRHTKVLIAIAALQHLAGKFECRANLSCQQRILRDFLLGPF
jgi:hypothetical protein